MVRRLDDRATWLVGRAHLRSHRLLHEAFAEAGARPYHYRVLAALEESGPLSQADLGRLTDLDRSDVTTSLDALGRSGLTVREPDPAHRRRNRVSITEAGRAELLRLDAVLSGVQDRFLGPLSEPERVVFLDLAARLAGDGAPGGPGRSG
ncbi:MarR family transcriptional regulator [Nocardiopsis sp. N85]|uniref:MarR family winged helix-turn-helix transcriptional regulator n=1 Tax=Nocardiopsis sp. N85 TaxID=3029400 RepID=UPI00237F301D|nr:MarR family transcriptional regulator [Nocardiopsis sp. N85]MDE3720384.1 MarR family transcriptional regulator [Nocardiopsis sp. N85]